MHMADALLSPGVAGTVWAASTGLAVYSANRVQQRGDDRLVALMGVSGAFVFAAQMVNFGIPGTGSSGHLGGGLLLAALLGPHAAFLVMLSVLVIQALFFADGGLLALGCNIFNLGVFPCFVAYPLLFRPIVGNRPTYLRLLAGSLLAAILGLQLGALGVVLQTSLSGRAELPFDTFLLVMLPIHLAIGVVEGLATASVLGFVWKARPELLTARPGAEDSASTGRGIATGLLLASLVIGGLFSSLASSDPDGLEWAIERTAGTSELAATSSLHDDLARLQQRAALLPDYDFRLDRHHGETQSLEAGASAEAGIHVNPGASVSGIVGSLLVLLAAGLIGYFSRFAGMLRAVP